MATGSRLACSETARQCPTVLVTEKYMQRRILATDKRFDCTARAVEPQSWVRASGPGRSRLAQPQRWSGRQPGADTARQIRPKKCLQNSQQSKEQKEAQTYNPFAGHLRNPASRFPRRDQ